MPVPVYETLFQQHILDAIFPADRADQFFEALFGDAAEGAYDISLVFRGAGNNRIDFEFQLSDVSGKVEITMEAVDENQEFLKISKIIEVN